MHLLFVSSLLPERHPSTGFEIANRVIVDGYEAIGARITVAGFRRPGAERPVGHAIDLGELAIENAGAHRMQKLRWVANALKLGLPVGAAKLRALPERELLSRLKEAGPFDAVVLSSAQMPIAYPGLLDLAPPIFVAHNVEHLSAEENARSASSAAMRALYRREARLLRGHEARISGAARAIHTLAVADAERLGLGGDPRSVPLSLTIGRQPASPDRPQVPETAARDFDVVLIGTWSWAPNRMGVDWFASEVAPRLDPDIRVAVAGRFDGAPPAAPASVRFLGRVPDAQGFLRSGRVVALPTRGGTGVQLKTIETLEEGLPAVATPSALRGLGAVLPSNVRVADDPQGFADALGDLVRRDREGERLRLDGRAFAARQTAELKRGLGMGLDHLGLQISQPFEPVAPVARAS